METQVVELKIELGDRSLSITGTLEEVMALASRYWPDLAEQPRTFAEDEAASTTPAVRPRNDRAKRVSKTRADNATSGEEALDAMKIANAIKVRPDFDLINNKYLMVPGQWPDKCRLVALIADGPITSGDVRRVMEALKIKADLPTLSKALSANSTDFLTSGSNPVRYELTARAKAAFIQSLTN
jgi:hypothetical protein